MTKIHQELVRGPISAVRGELKAKRGEFTVVAYIGHITDQTATPAPSDASIATEFGEITELSSLSRRKALNVLARRHDMAPNEVYEAIERAKKLVTRQK